MISNSNPNPNPNPNSTESFEKFFSFFVARMRGLKISTLEMIVFLAV